MAYNTHDTENGARGRITSLKIYSKYYRGVLSDVVF